MALWLFRIYNCWTVEPRPAICYRVTDAIGILIFPMPGAVAGHQYSFFALLLVSCLWGGVAYAIARVISASDSKTP
jgi:hypothetical protein